MSKNNWRVAESLKKLREQINTTYPNRDKSSDGSIGDQAHSSRKSDHNPNAAGVVCAIDTDEDLAPNIHSIENIVSAIRASRDKRVKYIIYEGRITVEGSELQIWKRYTGANPHNHHAHISVSSSAKLYDDASPWSIGLPVAGTAITPPASHTVPPKTRDLIKGDKGTDVTALQKKLGIAADGVFGKTTEAAVKKFQRSKGLSADGWVGAKTRAALGL